MRITLHIDKHQLEAIQRLQAAAGLDVRTEHEIAILALGNGLDDLRKMYVDLAERFEDPEVAR